MSAGESMIDAAHRNLKLITSARRMNEVQALAGVAQAQALISIAQSLESIAASQQRGGNS